MPEFVADAAGLGDVVWLYSIIPTVTMKSTREIIKRKMANPSI
jgi:hypothetical protein